MPQRLYRRITCNTASPGTQKGPKVSGKIFFFSNSRFRGERKKTRLILIVVVVVVVVVSVLVIIVGHKNLTLKFVQNWVNNK